MVISKIEINTNRLNDDIRTLRTQLTEARSHIRSLQSRMDAMNSMWSGDANAAMRQRFLADYENMISFCNFIEGLINSLDNIRQSYDTCENNVLSAVNALHVG